MNNSTLVFFYDALGPKAFVLWGLAALAAMATVAVIVFVAVCSIRNRNAISLPPAGSQMDKEPNPYQAPQEESQPSDGTAPKPRSFQPSDRSWGDLLLLLGIGLAVAVGLWLLFS